MNKNYIHKKLFKLLNTAAIEALASYYSKNSGLKNIEGLLKNIKNSIKNKLFIKRNIQKIIIDEAKIFIYYRHNFLYTPQGLPAAFEVSKISLAIKDSSDTKKFMDITYNIE